MIKIKIDENKIKEVMFAMQEVEKIAHKGDVAWQNKCAGACQESCQLSCQNCEGTRETSCKDMGQCISCLFACEVSVQCRTYQTCKIGCQRGQDCGQGCRQDQCRTSESAWS